MARTFCRKAASGYLLVPQWVRVIIAAFAGVASSGVVPFS